MDRIKLDIIAQGLRDASDELYREKTVRRGYLKELARLSLRNIGGDYGELFSVGTEPSGAVSAVLDEVKKLAGRGESGAIYALYASELYEKLCGKLPSDITHAEAEEEPILCAAFVSGSGADAAFEIFRRKLGLSPLHAERISGACDAVLDGDAGYCILPLKSGRDGRLRSFYRMMDVYDLKISAASVAGTDENTTRYALCSRSAKPLSPSPTHMELSSPANGAEALAIAEAARTMGHELFELSSSPSEHGGEVYSFTFALRGDYRPLILYLNIFHPRYTLTGLYNMIYDN